MEGVERTNTIMVNPQQQWTEFGPKHNPHTIKVGWRRDYNCKELRHIAKYCRNWNFVE